MYPPKLIKTAPKRIWLQIDTEDASYYGDPFPDSSDGEVTWCDYPQGGTEVGYVRADIVAELATEIKEQARLLGMSGSKELKLIQEIQRLRTHLDNMLECVEIVDPDRWSVQTMREIEAAQAALAEGMKP